MLRHQYNREPTRAEVKEAKKIAIATERAASKASAERAKKMTKAERAEEKRKDWDPTKRKVSAGDIQAAYEAGEEVGLVWHA